MSEDEQMTKAVKKFISDGMSRHGHKFLFHTLGCLTAMIRNIFGYEQMNESVNDCMNEIKRREMN